MKTIYEFDKLKDCYSFNATTVSYLVNQERRINKLLKSKSNLSIDDRIYLKRRLDETIYMYSNHSLISIVTNDQVLNAICESVNFINNIDSNNHEKYYLPFGIYGLLQVSKNYLKSINGNPEEFRKDLFNKVGFEYKPVEDLISDDNVDFDELRSNGIKYSINGINYGVDFPSYRGIDFYLKNMEFAPKVKIKK